MDQNVEVKISIPGQPSEPSPDQERSWIKLVSIRVWSDIRLFYMHAYGKVHTKNTGSDLI